MWEVWTVTKQVDCWSEQTCYKSTKHISLSIQQATERSQLLSSVNLGLKMIVFDIGTFLKQRNRNSLHINEAPLTPYFMVSKNIWAQLESVQWLPKWSDSFQRKYDTCVQLLSRTEIVKRRAWTVLCSRTVGEKYSWSANGILWTYPLQFDFRFMLFLAKA